MTREEYYDDIQRQIAAIQPTKPREGLDTLAREAAIDARNFGRQFPRGGQPSMGAPLEEWYRERAVRWRLMVEELEAQS